MAHVKDPLKLFSFTMATMTLKLRISSRLNRSATLKIVEIFPQKIIMETRKGCGNIFSHTTPKPQ